MINTTDSNANTNGAIICGEVIDGLRFSHRTYGEAFYNFTLGVLRNSGYEDQIAIMVSERIISTIDIEVGQRLRIQGQVRTYNEEVGGHNKLNIVVFAREIEEVSGDEESINEIYLEGFICKKPLQRTSPLGRKISDLMLAVNRMYNKSDYIPCIAWGRNAIYASTLDVGDKIAIHGRLQSRQYKKKCEDGGVIIKTAYEVSILQLETYTSDMV